jgi:hypothetical protein
MIMRLPLLTILTLLYCSICNAQEIKSPFKGTIAFVELVGHNLTYSINAERSLKQIEDLKLGVRLGFGGIPDEYGAVLGVTGFTGNRNGHLDFGVALSYVYGAQSYQNSGESKVLSSTIFFVPSLGYRYQKSSGGFFFKVGFTPLFKLKDIKEEFSSEIFWKVLPSAGISFGYYFKKD